MPEISSDEGQNLRPREGQPRELVIGDADNVEKTTYVVGKGTDPNARKGEGPSATVPSRGAPGMIVGVVIALVVLVLIGYLVGIGR